MNDKKVLSWALFACGCTAVICLLWAYLGASIIYWIHSESFKDAYQISDAGSWGESFAALNTLFSGFAFTAVATTIFMQYYSNKERNIEKEVDNKKYLKDQFDKKFYQILNMIEKSRSNLYFKNNKFPPQDGEELKQYNFGYLAFDDAYYALHETISESFSKVQLDRISKSMINIIADHQLYKQNDSLFEIYFRTLYTLLKIIDEATILTKEEKYNYANLLRTQLSSREVIIIAINGLNRKSKDLKKYIIEYRLLRYSENGLMRRILRNHYPQSTFEARDD